MRSIALAMATFLVFVAATVAPARAAGPADVEIEEAPSDEGGADDIMSGPKKREPAAPEIQYGAKGFYGIVAGTYGIEDLHDLTRDVEDNFKGRTCGPSNARCTAEYDNALGFNLRIGDRWHPNLATEVEFEWLDGFDAKEPDNINDPPNSPLNADGGVGEMWSFTVNQKAFLTTGKFQPFIFLGLGALGAIDSQARDPNEPDGVANQGGTQGVGFGFKAGAGFSYYFNEHFGLNTDFAYNVGTGSVNDLRFTSFSWGFILHP